MRSLHSRCCGEAPSRALLLVVRLTLLAVVALLTAWSLLIPDVYPRLGDPGPWDVARAAALAFSGAVAAWTAVIRYLRRRRAGTSTIAATALVATTLTALGIGLLYFVALALGAAPDRG